MMKNLLNQNHNVLLGATELNELVFANINIREKIFSVSFSLVTPTIIDNDYLLERFTSLMEDLPKEDLYDLCVQNNCSPNELIDTIFAYTSPEDILDLSLFPEQIEVNNGDTWVFESAGCGQIETRNVMSKYVDKISYLKLMLLWDNYHLQPVDEDIMRELETIIEKLNQVDQMEWIEDYIIENNYR